MSKIPSIALIPSGYKASKLYSVLPTNGDGDFTTTRASIATRVNENGLLEEVASNVPRLDYSDGGCPSLLLEPTATNLITYSEDFSNASWSKGPTIITPNSAISPDGTLNASLWSHSGGSFPQLSLPGITFVGGANYTPSLYVKSDGTSQVQHSLLVNNVVVNFTPTNEWVRISDLIVSPDTSGSFVIAQNSSSAVSASFYIWGASLEQNSHATSYIKTVGSPQTRTADTASGSGNSTVINSSEGVLYFEGIATNPSVSANSQISISSATNSGNNRVMITPSSDTQLALRFNAGGTQLVTQAVAVSSLSVNSKIAVRWGNGNYSLYQNGSEVYTQAIASTPIGLAKLNFSSVTETNNFNGKVKSLQVYTTALSDAELTTLTTI